MTARCICGASPRAVDTGIAVNPDTIVAQLQGGLIFGLTAALWGEVTIDKGRVQQSNFNDYRMLRIDEMPPIEVHVIKSGERPGGIGETGATAGPPALRNAIYAATGVRAAPPADRPRRSGGEEGVSAMRTHPARHRRRGRCRRRRRCAWHLSRSRSAGVRRRPTVCARRLSRRRSDRRSGRTRQRRPGQARRISRHAPPTAWSATPRRAARRMPAASRSRCRSARSIRPTSRADKETGIGDYSDAGFPQRRAARHPPGRRAALSGDAVSVLHLHDRRRRAGDQGLSVQPARRARRRTAPTRCAFPSISAG